MYSNGVLVPLRRRLESAHVRRYGELRNVRSTAPKRVRWAEGYVTNGSPSSPNGRKCTTADRIRLWPTPPTELGSGRWRDRNGTVISSSSGRASRKPVLSA